MRKIEINLNPQKTKASDEVMRSVTSFTPLMGLFTIIALVFIFFLQIVALKKTHSERVLAKKWQTWAKRSQLLKEIKDDIAALEEEEEKLKKTLVADQKTAATLEGIYSALPPNIWFKDLNFKNDFVNIQGYVVKWDEDYLISLDKFINSLSANALFYSRFSKVNIKQSQITNYNGVEVLDFIIECKK